MISYRKQRKLRNSLKFSKMGKQSQRIQAARREAKIPERLREIAEIEANNLPHRAGDVLGSFQWTDARSGKVRRWIVRIGDRADRFTFEDNQGTRTASHGWTWFFTRLRAALLNKL